MSCALLFFLALAPTTALDGREVTLLDGTWEARFSDEGGTSERGEWHPVRVPGNLPFQGITYDGIVWLKTSFTVEDASVDYAVRIPMASNAYQLFLNGTLLGGRGVIGPRGELVEKDLRGRVYRLPKDLLRTATPNSLSLRLRTFYGNGGIVAPGVWAGPEEVVRQHSDRSIAFVSMLVSLFFFAAFFHLILYFAHRDERQYLSFTFLAASLGTVTVGINTLGYLVTSNADFNAYLVFVPLLVLPVCFVQFFADFFGRRAKRVQQVKLALAVVSMVVLVSSTIHHPLYPLFERLVLPVSVLALASAIVLSTFWTLQAFLRRQRGARTILIGLAVYALTGLMELAWTFALIPFRVDSYVGFAFFVGAMVVAISGRFAWLHRQVELGERDALTGCLTRHGFMTKLPTLLQAGGPLSCILFDLDHFKRINDTLGHIEGDRVLGATGHALRRVIRETDVAVRWGGEEFLVLLPAQALSTAVDVANRLRVALKRAETGAPFTASFGVSVREKNEGFETWIARTDRALYAAKQGGRDAIRSAEAA